MSTWSKSTLQFCTLTPTPWYLPRLLDYDPRTRRAGGVWEAVVMNSLQTVVVVVHLFTRLGLREAPPNKNPRSFGHCPFFLGGGWS